MNKHPVSNLSPTLTIKLKATLKMANSDNISLDEMIELSRAFQKSRIFLTAYETDVITILGDKEKSSKEISDATSADHHGTDRLLNGLCILKALKKSGDKLKFIFTM